MWASENIPGCLRHDYFSNELQRSYDYRPAPVWGTLKRILEWRANMKKLKDYIEWQDLFDVSDIEIITRYFIDNDMEEEGMELSHKLAKSKIQKMKDREHKVKEWVYTIPSDYLYENYPVKIATMLHRIELDYIVNGEVTGNRLSWAKENIPNIQSPYVYFQPCIDWLEKNGIKFMSEGM